MCSLSANNGTQEYDLREGGMTRNEFHFETQAYALLESCFAIC